MTESRKHRGRPSQALKFEESGADTNGTPIPRPARQYAGPGFFVAPASRLALAGQDEKSGNRRA